MEQFKVLLDDFKCLVGREYNESSVTKMQERYEKFSSYFKEELLQETIHKIAFVKEPPYHLSLAFKHTNVDNIELCVCAEDGNKTMSKSKNFPRLGFERRLTHVNHQLSKLAPPVSYQNVIDIVLNDFFANI